MPKVKKEDNVLYAGADEWVNTRTGQVITANQIIKKTDRNGFSSERFFASTEGYS